MVEVFRAGTMLPVGVRVSVMDEDIDFRLLELWRQLQLSKSIFVRLILAYFELEEFGCAFTFGALV